MEGVVTGRREADQEKEALQRQNADLQAQLNMLKTYPW